MASPDANTVPVIGAPIQLALALNFVRVHSSNLPPAEGPQLTPADQALNNVVPMSAQYQWLAVKAQTQALQFDPGVKDPASGYPIAGFIAALDQLLQGLVDVGITYTAATYWPNHVLKAGRWVPRGRTHLQAARQRNALGPRSPPAAARLQRRDPDERRGHRLNRRVPRNAREQPRARS